MKTKLSILFAGLSCALSVSADSFGFATWNVGHFAGGLSNRSAIAARQVPEMSARYRALLVHADVRVLGVCEHSRAFAADGTAEAAKTAFADFGGRELGKPCGWQENAFYWNGCELLESGRYDFPLRRDKAQCHWMRLKIFGRAVCFVEAHCDWRTTAGRPRHDRHEQLDFLVRTFAAEPRIVIAGDFNTVVTDATTGKDRDAPEEYEVFRKAGFKAAHWGELKTWPAKSPRQCLDNVFVKGLAISEVKVLKDAALSDHALVRCTLSFEKGADGK